MLFVLHTVQGVSVVTRPVSQLARLTRFAFNLAQSGFESLAESPPDFPYPSSNEKHDFNKSCFSRAGVQGLEPRYSGPKPDVLPLDDTPIFYAFSYAAIAYHTYNIFSALSIPSLKNIV